MGFAPRSAAVPRELTGAHAVVRGCLVAVIHAALHHRVNIAPLSQPLVGVAQVAPGAWWPWGVATPTRRPRSPWRSVAAAPL